VLLCLGSSQGLYSGKQVVVEGDAFNITCETDLFAFIKWRKDSSPVGGLLQQYNITEQRGHNTITSSISNSHAQTSHSGSYRCGTFVENSYNLYVLSGKGDMLILCLACVNVPNMCDMAWVFTSEVFCRHLLHSECLFVICCIKKQIHLRTF